MNQWNDNTEGDDERLERLISRHLDGEISVAEQAELDGVLQRDPRARALFDECRRIDQAARTALRLDLDGVATASMAGPRRGLWLAAAGAVLTMAAVVALSFLPRLWNVQPNPTAQVGPHRPSVVEPVIEQPTFVDYRDTAPMPVRRFRDIRRDVIGIPGPTKDSIYILERNVHSTRVQPISGDF